MEKNQDEIDQTEKDKETNKKRFVQTWEQWQI